MPDNNDTINDLLNMQVTEDDLQPALFKDGAQVLFEIAEAELKTEEADGIVDNYVQFQFKTLNKEPNTKGDTFPVGFPYGYRMYLNKVSRKGNDLTGLLKRNIAAFRKATVGTAAGSLGEPAQYVGKRLVAVMSVSKRKSGSLGNEIESFVPLVGSAPQASTTSPLG